MGCWNETCALTQVPIHGDWPVVMVRMSYAALEYRNQVWGTLPGFRNQPGFRNHDWGHILGIYRGTYNSYGGIDEREDPDLLLYPVGLDRLCIDLRDSEFSLFFHQEVWDEVPGLFPEGELEKKFKRTYHEMTLELDLDYFHTLVNEIREKDPGRQDPAQYELAKEKAREKWLGWEGLREWAWKNQAKENEQHVKIRQYYQEIGEPHSAILYREVPREEWDPRYTLAVQDLPPRRDQVTKEDLSTLIHLVHLATQTRRDLFAGLYYRGHQQWQGAAEYQYLHQKSQVLVDRFFHYYDDEEDEEETPS